MDGRSEQDETGDGASRVSARAPGRRHTRREVLAASGAALAAGCLRDEDEPWQSAKVAVDWTYSTGSKINGGAQRYDDTILINDQDGVVHAVDLAGEPRWTTDIGQRIERTGPTIGDDGVYIGTDPGDVHKLDPKNGEKLQTYPIKEGRVEKKVGVDSHPTYNDGALYVGLGNGVDYPGGVVSLDAATGKERWEIREDMMLQRPIVDDNLCYIFLSKDERTNIDTQPRVRAVDASNGERVWQYDLDGGAFLIGTRGPHLFVLTTHILYKLDKTTGELVWRRQSEMLNWDATLSGDALYVSRHDHKPMWKLDADTGEPIWTTTLPDDLDASVGSPATVADGRVYMGTKSGKMLAVDDADGSVLWRQQVAMRPLNAKPIIDGDRIYQAGTDDTLYALRGPGAAITGE